MNQDAWEALVCFICSSNNNISRISQMAHKLCVHYGARLGTVDGEDYHDFPPPAALAKPSVEAHLRQLGFGYRAKYIVQTAQTMCEEKPQGWLNQLRNPACPPPWEEAAVTTTKGDGRDAATSNGDTDVCPATYTTAHEQLLTLSGVGPKVADCVSLMGLGWGEAVPVDTHVWQIAVRDYKFKKIASKTFSRAIHDAVGDHFRKLWGPYAGWAQSVLFTANLKSFSERLKTDGEAEGASPNKTPKQEILDDVGDKEVAIEVTVTKRKRKTVVKVEEDVKVAVVQEVLTRSKRRRRG